VGASSACEKRNSSAAGGRAAPRTAPRPVLLGRGSLVGLPGGGGGRASAGRRASRKWPAARKKWLAEKAAVGGPLPVEKAGSDAVGAGQLLVEKDGS
jgi:hypothetical protein